MMFLARVVLGAMLLSCCLGNNYDILQNKIYAMESSIHQDIRLLRQNVGQNTKEMEKVVATLNATIALFTGNYTNVESVKYPQKKVSEISDQNVNVIRAMQRAIHDEKRYVRDVHARIDEKLQTLASEESNLNFKLDSILNAISNMSDSFSTKVTNLETKLSESRSSILKEFKQLGKETKEECQELREETKEEFKVQREETKEEFKTIHEHIDDISSNTGLGQILNRINKTTSSFDIKQICALLNLPLTNCDTNECCMQLLVSTYTQGPFVRRGNVRLANISYSGSYGKGLQGRLEILHNNEWGTVCDDDFGDTDATVVCKEFGFTSGTARDKAYYGKGSKGAGRIWLDQVGCSGSEVSVLDCYNRGYGIENCGFTEDVGVMCT